MRKYLARLALVCSLLLLAGCSGLAAGTAVSPPTPPAQRPATVYYGAYDNDSARMTVAALDGSSGALRWSYAMSGDAGGLPVLAEGVVYVASSARLIALNASDGKLLWSNAALTNAQVIGAENGAVYANVSSFASSGALTTSLDAVHTNDGSLRWSHEFHHGEGDVLADGVIYGSDSLTPFGTPSSPLGAMVVALNASDGSVKWQSVQEAGSLTSVRVAQGLLYSYHALSTGGPATIEARHISDGSTAWRFPSTPAHVTILGLQNDVLYAQGDDGNSDLIEHVLYALNATTGAVIWRSSVQSSPLLMVHLVQQMLYVGDGTDNTLTAINAATGKQRWQAQLGAPSGATATDDVVVRAVVDGIAYLSSPDEVAALNASTGSIIWKASDTSEHALFGARDGIISGFSATNERDATLVARSAKSGAVLWSRDVMVLLGDPIFA